MLSTLDWSVVAIYLITLVTLSVYPSGRQETVEDYFVANNRAVDEI
jgi:Na+/proline symporter